MFMAVLFIIAKNLEAINGILLSDKKKWAIKSWRNLKCVLLNERSQSENAVWFQLSDILEKAKLLEVVKRSVVAGGWEVGDEKVKHRSF